MICSICGGLVRWNERFTERRCEDCGAVDSEMKGLVRIHNFVKPCITKKVIDGLKEAVQELHPSEDFYLYTTPENIKDAIDVLIETGTVCLYPCRGCGKPIVIKDLKRFDPDSHYCGGSPRCAP